MSRKRILFVVEAMGGGVFTYIVDLANELCKSYDMYVAYSVRPQTPTNYVEFFDSSIKLIEVRNFTRSVNLAKDLKAMIEIRKIAKSVRPNVIHLHSSKAGVLGRIVFSGKRTPLFYTPHGYSFLMEDQSTFKRRVFKTIEKLCAKRLCTTISCSYGEHIETLKITGRAQYINNGINTVELDSILHGIEYKEHPFTVFTIGRICYQKNPEFFNSIAEAMPETRFLWIGDGELKEELKASNIEITGWLSRKEALSRCINADVFLLTSLWEGLPISLLEAMYMKKLCVVSNVIGNRDVINNGKNGFVCEDIKDFIMAIRTNNCRHIVENALKDIMNVYNTEVMAKRYIGIYEGKTE